MLASGASPETINFFMEDPAVNFQVKTASLFDRLEDQNGQECLEQAIQIADVHAAEKKNLLKPAMS